MLKETTESKKTKPSMSLEESQERPPEVEENVVTSGEANTSTAPPENAGNKASVEAVKSLESKPKECESSEIKLKESTAVAPENQANDSKAKSSPNGLACGLSNLSELEKKQRRAERFGVALQLSEEEKRLSRAARFSHSQSAGLTIGSSLETKLSEEKKLKARAERFGIAFHSPADDEARKKARLARFGEDAKMGSPEEDKRKARTVRFSTAVNESGSNGDENLQPGLASTVAST
eukprot:TRINITY_DN321_c0_g1_i1.p1 TRINITY_DN321_c0_g1~~TRINITY_DN321_c0_g1_i1.p1  ORF type:complete len:236 (+),score=50.04 TRINITY_DN321_c0_g1_i1:161-868(+)